MIRPSGSGVLVANCCDGGAACAGKRQTEQHERCNHDAKKNSAEKLLIRKIISATRIRPLLRLDRAYADYVDGMVSIPYLFLICGRKYCSKNVSTS